jgi:hypothetical protein
MVQREGASMTVITAEKVSPTVGAQVVVDRAQLLEDDAHGEEPIT